MRKAGQEPGCGRIAPTAQKLGYHLRELEGQMGMYDGVEHSFQPNGTGGRKHRFQTTHPNQFDEWTEMEDFVLPF